MHTQCEATEEDTYLFLFFIYGTIQDSSKGAHAVEGGEEEEEDDDDDEVSEARSSVLTFRADIFQSYAGLFLFQEFGTAYLLGEVRSRHFAFPF